MILSRVQILQYWLKFSIKNENYCGFNFRFLSNIRFRYFFESRI